MTGRKQLVVVVSVLVVVAIVGAGLRSVLRDELSPVGVGAKAPSFAARTLEDQPVVKTLADYQGKVVLLNIWATWCAPCRVEMPSIEQLHQALAPRGLEVIAVSVDDAGMSPQIRSFAQEYGLTFDILHDPGGPGGMESSISRDYQVTGFPETVIIGRDGIIRRKLLGAHNWNSEENRALIERLLGEGG